MKESLWDGCGGGGWGNNHELGDNFKLPGDYICKRLGIFDLFSRSILYWSKFLKVISPEILIRFEKKCSIFAFFSWLFSFYLGLFGVVLFDFIR